MVEIAEGRTICARSFKTNEVNAAVLLALIHVGRVACDHDSCVRIVRSLTDMDAAGTLVDFAIGLEKK